MAYVQFGEYEDDGLGKKRGVRGLLRKYGGFVAGATGGLIPGLKPEKLGVHSKSGKKAFRIGRIVGAVTAGIFLAPIVAPYIASAGSATMGGLKFIGGKLVSAPASFLQMLTGKGIDPKTADPGTILQEAQQAGTITPDMVSKAYEAYTGKPTPMEYPGRESFPSRPTEEEAGPRPVSEGGMFAGVSPVTAVTVGAGVLAILLFGGKKGGR